MGDSFLFNTRENATSIFNTARLSIIILQVSIIGIIAIGVTQVIISGGIDLSSGSIVGRHGDDRHELRPGLDRQRPAEPEDDAARRDGRTCR